MRGGQPRLSPAGRGLDEPPGKSLAKIDGSIRIKSFKPLLAQRGSIGSLKNPATVSKLIIENLLQRSESRKRNPLELSIGGFEGGLVFGVGAASASNTALAYRLHNPQFVVEQEFGVEGTVFPLIHEVVGKVVISSIFVSLVPGLPSSNPHCHQRNK